MLLIAIGLTAPARAQEFLDAQDIPEANHRIDTRPARNSLKCDIRTRSPFIDFNFRYVTTFLIFADFTQFRPGDGMTLLLRVTPAQSEPVLLAQNLKIQQIPPDMVSSFRPKSVRLGIAARAK